MKSLDIPVRNGPRMSDIRLEKAVWELDHLAAIAEKDKRIADLEKQIAKLKSNRRSIDDYSFG